MRSSASNAFSTLRVGFCNVNSIFNKVHIIYEFLLDNNLDFFGVAETWLLPDVPDSYVSIDGYRIVRSDTPTDTRKHGVCAYVRNNVHFSELDVTCSNVCAIHLIDFNLYVLILYRPPSNSNAENAELLEFLLNFCPSKEILLIGDFNLPMIDWQHNNFLSDSYPPLQQRFIDCFISLGLHQWVHSPTFLYSKNTLDLVLSSEGDRIGEVEVLANFPNCGHSPLVFQYYFQVGVYPHLPSHRPKYSWHRGNYWRINSLLCDIDWEFELQNLSVDSMFCKLKEILDPLIQQYVPTASCNLLRKQKSPPGHLKAERKSAWQSFKQSRSTYGRQSHCAALALDKFLTINNLYRNYFVKSQIDFEKSLISKVKSDPKALHKYIRAKKVGAPSIGPLRQDDGKLTAECAVMAELFASSFSSVYTTRVPYAPFPHQISDASINDVEITIEDVRARLSSLDVNSSMGPDGLHPCLLKSCPNLAIPLYTIFRKSVSQGKLPLLWKSSQIIPLFKKGSRHVALNYRPISLTSVCCKTLERILAKAIFAYLEENQLLSQDQFGFRQGRTVDDQLLVVYNDVTCWMESGYSVDIVLFDFSKAFDVVSHSILIDKLRLIGVGGPLLGWIHDFLIGRTMSVAVSGVSSSCRHVLSGVPQGSVLGPLLFLIFINHLPSFVKSNCKFFADDMKIYMKLRHENTASLALDLSSCQRDINQVYQVAQSWGLSFNPDKCVVLRCQRGTVDWANVGAIQHYYLDSSQLSLTDSPKDLGILVDNTLRFHAHVKMTVNKAAGLANNLLKATLCRSADFMTTIFKTHVRPILEFGSPVWHTGYLGDMKLLESVQRRWTKQVVGLQDYPYAQRLRQLNLFSVQGRLVRADLIKYWKIFHGHSPIVPSDFFTMSPATNTRGHRFKLLKPHASLECRRRFFCVRGIDAWNSLPEEVVCATTIESFKKGLHQNLGDTLFSFTDNN